MEGRQGELWRRLEDVNDPELDESVVSMGFVESAKLAEDGSVSVEFRLPTYWCSPNFAFLMLEDLRTALNRLSWQPRYTITLLDHLMGEEINAALAAGLSFDEIVGKLAPDADIRGLRVIFTMKAFKRRQEAVLLALRNQGLDDAAILAIGQAALLRLGDERVELAPLARRYTTAFAERFPLASADGPAFLTWEGEPVRLNDLPRYMGELRAVRINMEFNGALCRGLKQSRYQEVARTDDGPTLADFILGQMAKDAPRDEHRH
jgi:metal-sulfur cluster biosynthetic enzyme